MNRKKTIMMCFTLALGLQVGAQDYPFRDTRLSREERVSDLISRLTIDEKAKLLMHYSPAVDRLGLRQFQWWGEALHGVGFAGFATVFPEPIGMAASFDDALLYRVYDAVSTEARAKYNKAAKNGTFDTFQSVSMWTPNVNIFRDPRWGRGQETYGEDPYLMSRMGVAVVRGLQQPTPDGYYKTLACAKHFIVHSGPEWSRHRISIDNLSPRDFHETYAPAFKALVEDAGVREVMCAYNSIDGEPCCSDKKMLEQLLRDEWGFTGLVVSDCDAINDIWVQGHHGIEPDVAHASARGVAGGTDLNCGGSYVSLPEAVEKGLISEERINLSLRRVLMARMELGDFNPDAISMWNAIGMDSVNTPGHRKLALDMARETMTLLSNNGTLPLKKADGKIVVMGPNANDSTMQWGNYSGRPRHTVTVLEGIRNAVGADRVTFIDGCGYVTKNIRTENRFRQIKNEDGGTGLKATVWANRNMEGTPVATRLFDSPINFNLNEAGFVARGVARENFSMQLRGIFTATETEDLQLRIAGDDGYRLIFDGDTLFNEWRDQGTLYRDRMVRVEAGRTYQIQIDYYQAGSGAELQFDINRYRELTDDELLAQVPQDAETVIYVGGISPRLEGEEMSVNEPGFRGGDRDDIQMPERQRVQLKRLKAMGKRVVLVNCSGSCIALTDEQQSCDAILQAWYPGEQGGTAVAEALFGDINPSGKLPVTFYKSVADLPDFEDYSMKNRTYRYFKGEPLYPFGHGLSYTTFSIGKAKWKDGTLTFTVKNTGKYDGTETVQLYMRALDDKEGPLKSLCGFKRVQLKSGERKTVSIGMPRKAFERFDPQTNTVRTVPGKYMLYYGTSSADRNLKTLAVNVE